jgi:hypothetical protein
VFVKCLVQISTEETITVTKVVRNCTLVTEAERLYILRGAMPLSSRSICFHLKLPFVSLTHCKYYEHREHTFQFLFCVKNFIFDKYIHLRFPYIYIFGRYKDDILVE